MYWLLRFRWLCVQLMMVLLTTTLSAQTILYSTGFGSLTNQLPPQWTFSGDNMNLSNVGPSLGYPGASGQVYLAEGNHKGFRNTNGVIMPCSQTGTSTSTFQFSSANHTDLELFFGMYKSGAAYNTVVNYQLSWSTDGINFTPVNFTEAAAGRWGLVSLILPPALSNQSVVYLQWKFNRTGAGGFFKLDDVKIVAHDFCTPPSVLLEPVSPPGGCVGGSIHTFNVTALGTGPFTYQWQEDTTNITDGIYYTGAHTQTLEVLYPHFGFNGRHYRCIISNCSGDTVITDNNAVLSLFTIQGDLNFDGIVNNSDFVDLLVHWEMICSCSSDLNSDGRVDLLDYLIFVGQFNKACQ